MRGGMTGQGNPILVVQNDGRHVVLCPGEGWLRGTVDTCQIPEQTGKLIQVHTEKEEKGTDDS